MLQFINHICCSSLLYECCELTVYSSYVHVQADRKGVTRYGFEKQFIENYTRAAYSVFRERLYHSTAFRIKRSEEEPAEFLVHHYNQSKKFAWSRHEFRVYANETEGKYHCECKLWEHTGTI